MKRFGVLITTCLLISLLGWIFPFVNSANKVRYDLALANTKASNENQSEANADFIFERDSKNAGKIKLIGLTNQGKTQRVLFIPKETSYIRNKAFEGCSLHLSKLVFECDDVVIENEAFAGLRLNRVKCYVNNFDFMGKLKHFSFQTKNINMFSEKYGLLLKKIESFDYELIGLSEFFRISSPELKDDQQALRIPSVVTKIDTDAFSHVHPKVTSLSIESTLPIAIAEDVFKNTKHITSYFVYNDQNAVGLINAGVSPNSETYLLSANETNKPHSIGHQQGLIYKTLDNPKVLIGLTNELKNSADPIEIPNEFVQIDQHALKDVNPTRVRWIRSDLNQLNNVEISSSEVLQQDHLGFIIEPFQKYRALVGLSEANQETPILNIPAEVDFVRKDALAHSRATKINFLSDSLVNVAGGAKLPIWAEYSVYSEPTARQLIGAGVLGKIHLRYDQSIEQSSDSFIIKTNQNQEESLVGLTPSGQELTQLVINQDNKTIASDFFQDSQAMFIKFSGNQQIDFSGTLPNVEYEVEKIRNAFDLISYGAKRRIFVKENEICFSEEDLRNFIFHFEKNKIVLLDLNANTCHQDTLSVPAYVNEIAKGVFEKFKGNFVLMLSLHEISIDRAAPQLTYYVKNKATFNNLIKAGAARKNIILLTKYGETKTSKMVLVHSVLIALGLISLVAGISILIYVRQQKKRK